MKLTGGIVGIARWTLSTYASPPPLGINGLHCMQSLHEVTKFLLNLVLSELLALVKELDWFDKSI